MAPSRFATGLTHRRRKGARAQGRKGARAQGRKGARAQGRKGARAQGLQAGRGPKRDRMCNSPQIGLENTSDASRIHQASKHNRCGLLT